MRKLSKLWIVASALAFASAFFADVQRPSAPGQMGVMTLGPSQAHAGGVVRAVGRAIGGAFRAVGRAVGGAFRAVGRFVGNVARGIGKVVSTVGRAIGAAAKAIGTAVGSVVRTIGQGIIKGVKLIGGGLVQIGKGIVQVAVGIGKIAVGVVKGAVSFVGGVAKGLGHVIRGDFKGAWSAVKDGASSAVSHVVSGVKAGVSDIKKGVGNIIEGAGKVAVGLVQVALPFLDVEAIMAKIKEVIVGFIEKLAKGILGALDGVFGKVLGVIAPDIKGAIDTIRGLMTAGKQLLEAIQNPDETFHKGRDWAINKLTELGMRVFQPPLKKLVGALTGVGLKLLKHLITTPLTGMVTGAIASVTLGIGALAAPIIKLGIDKLMDWAIDMIKDGLAHVVMVIPFVKDFLRDRVISPLVNSAYDGLVKLVKDKFPQVSKYLTTTAERNEGVVAEKLFEKELKGVNNVLSATDKVLSAVRDPKAALKSMVANMNPVKAVVAQVESVLAQAKADSAVTKGAIAELQKNLVSVKGILAGANGLLSKAGSSASATQALGGLTTQLTSVKGFLSKATMLVKTLPAIGKSAAAAEVKKLTGALATVSGAFSNAAQVVQEVKASAAAQVKATAELVKKVGAVTANKIVAEAKVTAASAPALLPPASAPAPLPMKAVMAELGAKAKEAVVLAATSVKDAPIVVPAVDTGVSGMRTALRALYSMVIQEYRAIVNVTGVLYKAASQRVEGVTMASVARQLNAYRRAAHTVFRYIYQLRVLQLRALRRAGLEDVVERVTELMSLPSAGDDVVVDGEVKVEGLEKPFTDAKNALHRFAQTSTRLLLTNSELFEPSKRKLAQRITRVAGNHLARAKTSLDQLVQLLGTVNEAEGAAEADLEKAGGR